METKTIVLYPSPGMGHLISMVELGKFILQHNPHSFKIAILVAPPSFNTGSTGTYINHISSTVPSITFHHLPSIQLNDLDSFPSMESIIYEVLRLSNPHVRSALETISLSSTIIAFIIDFFCTTSLPIAKELEIPTYYFITSGACVLAFFLYFPTLHRNTTKSFKDMDEVLDCPGLPGIPCSDMLKPLLDRECTDYKDFLNVATEMLSSDGIIVNTFESLEVKALKAIREGKCHSEGNMPPVFCVGPLLAARELRTGGEKPDCLKWLDLQPSKSVVFLCFGSLGLLSMEQLKEIAVGLERSGHRFLWVVRSPPNKSNRFLPPPEPDLDALLPEGFLDRTRDRGFVVKSWAPQVAVLNHDSVGGFVTHCGWNSVLEGICAGVPMIAWPLYAEQHFNRVVLVEDMKLALRINEGADGITVADEVESRVCELMDSDSKNGIELRKLVKQRSDEAKDALLKGGSSISALQELIQLWKNEKLY